MDLHDQPAESAEETRTTGIGRRTLLKGAAAGAAAFCVPAMGANGAPVPGGWRGLSMAGQAEGGTLIVSVPFDMPPVYNPLISQNDLLMFSNLVRFDQQVQPIPQLATSWEISEDGLEYTFHLAEAATWHDGTPLTADDVVFTILEALKPEVNFLMRFTLQVNGVDVIPEAIDAHTVKITLPSPSATFLAHLAAPWVLQIAPKHLLEGENQDTAAFNTAPIGSGPFKFVEQVDGDHTTFEKFEGYFEGTPILDEMIFRPIVDMQARLAAFQAGETDIDNREEDLISTAQFGEVEGATPYILETPYVQQFTVNCEDPLFTDVKVRQAMAHALDRPAMVRTVIGDEAYAALSVMGPGHWAYDAAVPTYPYDVEKSKALLAEAGWVDNGGTLEKDGVKFSFTNNAWRDFERGYAPLIQQYLAEVGIEMNINAVPDYTTIETIRQDPTSQSLFYGSIDYEPGELHQYFHSSQFTPTGLNVWHYANPEVDELLEQGLATTDQAARTDIYKQIQQIIMGDCVTIPMHVHLNNLIVRTDRVAGFEDPVGNWLGVIFPSPWTLTKTES
ncbi:peptide-binding protein [soil metagenome]